MSVVVSNLSDPSNGGDFLSKDLYSRHKYQRNVGDIKNKYYTLDSQDNNKPYNTVVNICSLDNSTKEGSFKVFIKSAGVGTTIDETTETPILRLGQSESTLTNSVLNINAETKINSISLKNNETSGNFEFKLPVDDSVSGFDFIGVSTSLFSIASDGSTTAQGDLSVVGDTVLYGGVDVVGQTTLSGPVSFEDEATMSSALTVNAAATFTSTLYVGSTATFANGIVLSGGDFTMSSSNIDIGGYLDVHGPTTLGTSLSVTGLTTMSGGLTIAAGDIGVSSTSSLIFNDKWRLKYNPADDSISFDYKKAGGSFTTQYKLVPTVT